MEHLYKQLAKIEDKLDEMLVIQSKNTVVLDDHKLRSDRSEKRLDILEDEYKKFRGFFSIGGWILGIAATLLTVLSKASGFFNK